MTARTFFGTVLAALLFCLGVIPSFVHLEDCGPYAPTPPGLPEGAVAGCDDWSVTALSDTPTIAFMVLLCIAGSILAVRLARFRSVPAVAGISMLGSILGAIAGFIYSGISLLGLAQALDAFFVLCIVTTIAAIMGSIEIRRLPNKSLERTRER